MTKKPVFELNTSFLKTALLYAADKKQGRYYLESVAIFKRNDHIRIVATNGHILFCALQSIGVDHGYDQDFDKVLPATEVKRALTGFNKNFASALALDFSGPDSRKIILNGFQFEEVEGTYPDTTRVVPEKISDEIAHFDTKYLDVLQKSCKALDVATNNAKIHHNGNNPALISFGLDNCFALFMPVRPGVVHNKTHDKVLSEVRDLAGCTGPALQYPNKTKSAA